MALDRPGGFDQDGPVGAEHPSQLGQDSIEVQELDRVDADRPVERAIAERQRPSEIRPDQRDPQPLPSRLGAGPVEHAARVVEPDDVEPLTGEGDRVVPGPAPQVDHPAPRRERRAELVGEPVYVAHHVGIRERVVPAPTVR